jgi:hypothetical protein
MTRQAQRKFNRIPSPQRFTPKEAEKPAAKEVYALQCHNGGVILLANEYTENTPACPMGCGHMIYVSPVAVKEMRPHVTVKG